MDEHNARRASRYYEQLLVQAYCSTGLIFTVDHGHRENISAMAAQHQRELEEHRRQALMQEHRRNIKQQLNRLQEQLEQGGHMLAQQADIIVCSNPGGHAGVVLPGVSLHASCILLLWHQLVQLCGQC